METANEEEEGNEEEKAAENPKNQNTYKIYGTFKSQQDDKTPDYVKEIIKVWPFLILQKHSSN